MDIIIRKKDYLVVWMNKGRFFAIFPICLLDLFLDCLDLSCGLIRFYIFSYEDVLGLEVAVDGFVLLEDLVNL